MPAWPAGSESVVNLKALVFPTPGPAVTAHPANPKAETYRKTIRIAGIIPATRRENFFLEVRSSLFAFGFEVLVGCIKAPFAGDAGDMFDPPLSGLSGFPLVK